MAAAGEAGVALVNSDEDEGAAARPKAEKTTEPATGPFSARTLPPSMLVMKAVPFGVPSPTSVTDAVVV